MTYHPSLRRPGFKLRHILNPRVDTLDTWVSGAIRDVIDLTGIAGASLMCVAKVSGAERTSDCIYI